MAHNVLTAKEILAADDQPREWVAVPEWAPASTNGEAKDFGVYVSVMSGTDRDAFEASVVGDGKSRNMENFRSRVCARCIVDDKGKRLFADKDVVALGRKSGVALDRVWDKARKLNRMTEADMEELAGNSAATAVGDSSSRSRSR